MRRVDIEGPPNFIHNLLACHWSLERLQKFIRCNEGKGPTQRCRLFFAKRSFEAFLGVRPRALRLDELSASGSRECNEPIGPSAGSATVLMRPSRSSGFTL